jgi:DNA-binding FadR family transcriptional regulator
VKLSARPQEELRARLGRNLTHGLVDRLGRAIVMGEYDKSPLLTEADLAEQHDVSRSVIREAVKMLTAKGLLSARPRQGTAVEPASAWNLFDTDVLRWLLERRISIDLLRQFNQLRAAIEPEAAALAAHAASPADVARIASGLERMVAAEKGLDDALDADIAFHAAILGASGNPFYSQLRDMVGTALRTSIRFTNGLQGGPANVAEHALVLDAISSRKPDAARIAMRGLIDGALNLIEKHQRQAARPISV